MYQVLARKYRPRNFAQLVGQTHVSKALSSALERGRLHHAYLFTGTRGVGKTTIARILAKCLNCETGVTATPCEQCSICQAVNEGRFIDLIEIDAASRTKVEDTRELLDNVPYAPTQGRYKVYLIDEVHMLSTHSFNALLKTLEEPPEHVKFLFATTDPQKLPITIISRCLQFTLRPLSKQEIQEHLEYILKIEHIEHQQQALWQLAESAQGSLRDALSLTDQAIAYGQGQILYDDVKEMLGLIDKNLVSDLMLSIHQNNSGQVAQILQSMRQQSIDVLHVLEQFISCLHDVAILQVLGQQTIQQDLMQEQQQKLLLAQTISAQDLQLYYQIALQGRADLSIALTPEQGFEMCILRLLAFKPLQAGEYIEVTTPISAQTQSDHSTITQTLIEREHVDLESISESISNVVLSNPTHQAQYDDDITEHIEPVITQTFESEQTSEIESLEHQQKEPQNTLSKVSSPPTDEQEVDPILENEVQSDCVVESILQEKETQFVDVKAMEYPLIEPEHDLHIATDILPQERPHTTPQVDDPRSLLQPETQQLTGQWNLDKWDYWLRQADLSPAVKEIVQHGLMQGDIEGHSILFMAPSYKLLIEGFVDVLRTALKEISPENTFELKFAEISEITPIQLQQNRKKLAYQTAEQMIAQQPAIQSLITTFSAHIEELKFKD